MSAAPVQAGGDSKVSPSPTASPRPSRSGHGTFRPDIEGMRGIAVLLVVLYHVGIPGIRGGFIGVDVFFVLSGFLITDLLVKEAARTGRISFVQFYARRTRRLLPAAILVLTVTLVASLLVLSPLEQFRYAGSAVATSIYVSNLHFMRQATDYFGPNLASDPFLHTWSLAVEEQFYLVWPMLIALGFSGRRPAGRLIRLIIAVCVLSLAACVWLTVVRKPWAFFGSPLRAWEFGIGGLACLVPVAALRDRPGLCGALGWGGLVAVLIGAMTLTGHMLFPGPWAFLPAIGTVGMLLAGTGRPGIGVGVPLGSAPLQHLGRLSYSWYLWHWPVLVLALAVAPDLSVPAKALCAVGALAAAAVAFALVENRIRFHPALLPRPRFSLVLAAVLSIAGLAFGLGSHEYAQRLLSRAPQRSFAKAVGDGPALKRRGCFMSEARKGLRQCVFGDSTSSTTLVLFGDSHAAQWFPALEQVANDRHWRLVSMVRASCPVATVPVYDPRGGEEQAECAVWRRLALRRIMELRPALVVMANSVGYIKRPGESDGLSQLSYRQWGDGIRTTFVSLDSAGVRGLFFRDTPRAKDDVPLCLSRAAYFGWEQKECTAERDAALYPEIYHLEQQAASGLPHVSTVDLSDLICGPVVCETVQRDMVVYRDRSHLTATYARSLAPALAQRLVPLIGGAVPASTGGASAQAARAAQ
jgi:peptidoglycan/LPS O-acetylase OafA/YrhL